VTAVEGPVQKGTSGKWRRVDSIWTINWTRNDTHSFI